MAYRCIVSPGPPVTPLATESQSQRGRPLPHPHGSQGGTPGSPNPACACVPACVRWMHDPMGSSFACVQACVCVPACVWRIRGQVAGSGKGLARPRLPVFSILLPFSSGLSWTSSAPHQHLISTCQQVIHNEGSELNTRKPLENKGKQQNWKKLSCWVDIHAEESTILMPS